MGALQLVEGWVWGHRGQGGREKAPHPAEGLGGKPGTLPWPLLRKSENAYICSYFETIARKAETEEPRQGWDGEGDIRKPILSKVPNLYIFTDSTLAGEVGREGVALFLISSWTSKPQRCTSGFLKSFGEEDIDQKQAGLARR